MKQPGSRGRGASDRVERLQELRAKRQVTQVELAEILNVTQAALSKLERREDMKVSTLRGYVEALGGQLSVVATFGERSVSIDLPFDPAPISR